MNLLEVETELKKRWRLPYDESYMRIDIWQDQTNFVKQIEKFERLEDEIFQRFNTHKRFSELKNYAINRWYNHVSVASIKQLFKEHSRVRLSSSKLEMGDYFYIDAMPYQLRIFNFTTIFTDGFEHVRTNKQEIAKTMLQNSDIETNVIYLALYAKDGIESRLRCELQWMKEKVDAYLDEFEKDNISRVNRGGHIAFADLLLLQL